MSWCHSRACIAQGKTAWQAEIDAGTEAVDFLRYNSKYARVEMMLRGSLPYRAAEDIRSMQPQLHFPGTWNRLAYRALEVVLCSPLDVN